MKNSKTKNFFARGRRFVFSHAPKSQGIKEWLLVRGTALALFVLVFAAASIVKIQAAGNVTGWLWGGGAGPNDGTNTNVGWISMNNTNQGGATNYGVNFPSGTGDISGYAWSENIGWISFNAADLAGCPQGQCNAARVAGNNIKGWARIVGIKDAKASGNSGGWDGWVSLSGPQYGVKINADNTLTGYGWSASFDGTPELGWIDFSRATTCTNPGCATKQLCTGEVFTTCDASFCTGGGTCALNADQKSWICSNSCGSVDCSAYIQPRVDGVCGTADGGSFCGRGTPTNEELCSAGTSVPGASSIDLNVYEVSWQCQGVCGGTNEDCSAQGTKACGWIETNP